MRDTFVVCGFPLILNFQLLNIMATLTKDQQLNVQQLAVIGNAAELIAQICYDNKVTIQELMPFLTAVAERKLSLLK